MEKWWYVKTMCAPCVRPSLLGVRSVRVFCLLYKQTYYFLDRDFRECFFERDFRARFVRDFPNLDMSSIYFLWGSRIADLAILKAIWAMLCLTSSSAACKYFL